MSSDYGPVSHWGGPILFYVSLNVCYALIQFSYASLASLADSDQIPLLPEIYFQRLITAQPFIILSDSLLYRCVILPYFSKSERHAGDPFLATIYLLALSYPWDLMMCYYPGNGMNTIAIGLLVDAVLFIGLPPLLGLPEIGMVATLNPMGGANPSLVPDIV